MNNHKSDASAADLHLLTQVQQLPEETSSDDVNATSPNFGMSMGPSVPGYPFLSQPKASGEIGRLGDYRVLAKLGEGGMGFVFRAEDPALKRFVALKIMRPEIAVKPQAADRFLREGRAAACLKSDHVITIYQVGQANGAPFIAMEYLEGIACDEWMRQQKKAVPIALVSRIIRDTLRGLATAHEKGLIHRDIKPANLWIEKGTARIKVLDFGLTRGADGNDQMTADGTIVGTPAYMAPEQAAGKLLDPRADLFSVGTVMYHLIVGNNPFVRDNMMATMGAVSFDLQPPVVSLRPEIPQAYSDFVDRLLAKDPAGRPANAKVALAELAAIEKSLQDMAKTLASLSNLSLVTMLATAAPAPVAAHAWSEISVTDNTDVYTKIVAPATPRKPPSKKLLIGSGLFAFFALLLGGITIVITNKDGTKTKVEVPDGATIDVQKDGKSVANKVTGVKPSIRPIVPSDTKPIGEKELDFLAFDEKAAIFPPGLGTWSKRNGTWQTTSIINNFNVMNLPFPVDGSYTLTADVCLDSGNDVFGIVMPVGSRNVGFEFNGFQGKFWGFVDLKGLSADNPMNPTHRAKPSVIAGKRIQLTMTVKLDGEQAELIAAVEGHDPIPWKGPVADIAVRDAWGTTANRVSLLSNGSIWTVHGLKFKKLDGNTVVQNAIDPDRKVAEWIISKGGFVVLNNHLKYIEYHQVKDLPIEPFKINNIEFGDKAVGGITDADLDQFRELEHVVVFVMRCPNTVTDAGLAKWVGHPFAEKLHHVFIIDGELTDKAFESFAKFPAVRNVIVQSKRITGSGIAHLKTSSLEFLILGHCGLQDAEMVHLKNLPKLITLNVASTPIRDAGLKFISEVKQLNKLEIQNCDNITDVGLETLSQIKTLKEINLIGTKVTAVGVKKFRAALPECKIASDFPE